MLFVALREVHEGLRWLEGIVAGFSMVLDGRTGSIMSRMGQDGCIELENIARERRRGVSMRDK